jgi:hypothetical protein
MCGLNRVGDVMENEEAIYDAQHQWIMDHFGREAARTANYGWFVDDYSVSTKIYGQGVLMSCSPDDHTFTPFNEDLHAR